MNVCSTSACVGCSEIRTNALRMLQFYSECLAICRGTVMYANSFPGTVMRVNKRRWFGCKLLLFAFFFCVCVGENRHREVTEGEGEWESMGWRSFVYLFFVAPRRGWLLFDFIHVGCMCCLIQLRLRPNAFLQHSINPQTITPESFSFGIKCDFGKCDALLVPSSFGSFECSVFSYGSIGKYRLECRMGSQFPILIKNTLVTMI